MATVSTIGVAAPPGIICHACGSVLPFTPEATELLSSSLAGPEHFQHRMDGLHQRGEYPRMESEVHELDRHISQLQAALDRLKYDRHVLAASLNHHRTMQAPINRLPIELLSTIFQTCLPFGDKHARQSPFTLSSTCHRWRTVALSTPNLWSTIIFRLDGDDEEGDEGDEGDEDAAWRYPNSPPRSTDSVSTLIHALLPRSGQAPLYLDVDFFEVDHDSQMRLCDAIGAVSHRWQRAVLQTVAGETMERLHSASGLHSTLTSLLLDVSHPERPSCTMFRYAPRLQDVSIGISYLCECIALPWYQLCRLEAVMTAEEALNALEACPRLRTLIFWKRGSSPRHPIKTLPQTLHTSLRRLYLHESKGCDTFLGRVTLPHLRCLAISGSSANADTVAHFISRSKCSISALGLTGMHCPEDELLGILRPMRSLSMLSVAPTAHRNSTQAGRVFLHGLRRIDNDQPGGIAPNLEKLCLRYPSVGIAAEYADSLVDMVESRLPLLSGGRLRSFHIGNREIYERLVDRTGTWRTQGLDELLCAKSYDGSVNYGDEFWGPDKDFFADMSDQL